MITAPYLARTLGATQQGIYSYTLSIAKNLKDNFSIPMLAHLTCVSSDKATVNERITQLKENGIYNITFKNQEEILFRVDFCYKWYKLPLLKNFFVCVLNA